MGSLIKLLNFIIGFNWLEIKSRYLFTNELRINLKDNTKPLQILEICKSTFRLNLAIIICVCLLINSISLYCFTIKFFCNDVLFSLIQTNESFAIITNMTHKNDSSPIELTSSFKMMFKSSELGTNFIYFVYLISNRVWCHRFCKLSEDKDKKRVLKTVLCMLLYVLVLLVLAFTVSTEDFNFHIECENFFKNRANVSL